MGGGGKSEKVNCPTKNVPLMQMSLVIKGRALNVEYSFKAELFLNAGVG